MSEPQDRPKQPSHHAFQVKTIEDQTYFNRVGSAFEHKDNKGFNIYLDSVPMDGKITLRTPKERLADEQDKRPRRRRDKDQER